MGKDKGYPPLDLPALTEAELEAIRNGMEHAKNRLSASAKKWPRKKPPE
jgi:hypothetical protein